MRRRVEHTEDDEEDEDSSNNNSNSPQYDFATVDRDPLDEEGHLDDDEDDMDDDENDVMGTDQYDKEDTRDMYDVYTALAVYPDLQERFGRAIQVIEKWRCQRDAINDPGSTPYVGTEQPSTQKVPIVDPTEGFRHILTSAELLNEDGSVIIHDNQQQRTNAFLGQVGQDELRLTTFQKAWRENPDAWNNAKLHWAKNVVDGQFEQMIKLFYYLRFFTHSLTETLNSTCNGKFPYTSTALEETKHYQDVFNFYPAKQIAAPTDKMKLLQYALQEFASRRFKKKRNSDFIYEEVVYSVPGTTRMVHTCCYHSTVSIEDMLYKLVKISSRADLVQAMIGRSLVEDVLSFLRKGTFEEFPFLEVRDRLFSFTDGIWDADTDTFVDYDHVHDEFPDLLTGSVTYKFFDLEFAPVYWASETPPMSARRRRDNDDDDDEFSLHGSGGSKRNRREGGFTSPHYNYPTTNSPQPSPPHVARKTLKMREIRNPLFEKIFEDQGWSQESIWLKYATLGRTLWPAGEKDSCQYIPVDIGESATGKSTAQNVWQSVFHFTDIMVFGANQEKGFSRDKIVESRIFLAPDMRGDSFGISPEFFLVLAASDPCVFPRKHKDPIYVDRIRTPGMLATNELPPGFRDDVRGSIFRRLLPFGYTKEISPRDPGLKDRIIKTELAGVLRKAVLAYQDDEVHPRDRDIMTDYNFPPEIQLERNKLERSSNSLVDFLLSPSEVRKDPDGKTPYNQFVEAYGRFCKNNRRQKPCSFSVEFYTRPLKSIGAQVMVDDDGEPVVKGCTLVYHRDEETDDQ